MRNRDIDAFFAESGLNDRVEKNVRPPNKMWLLRAQGLPVLIQTQKDADRLRVVVFIADGSQLDREELRRLLDANYHSALDARYALAGDDLVAAFLSPMAELDGERFVLGFYQALMCALTWGTHYSGGTLVFGPVAEESNEGGGAGRRDLRAELVHLISSEPEISASDVN